MMAHWISFSTIEIPQAGAAGAGLEGRVEEHTVFF
jgi:hypothetical protein